MNKSPLHVYPLNDINEHVLENAEISWTTHIDRCPCGPTYRREYGRLIVVHRSFDGREAKEWIEEGQFHIETDRE